MKTLIISDVHANFPAFRTVLKDANKVDRIIFLGDLANFGPHPSECVNLLRQQNAICIMGNHDAQIISDHPEHPWDQWSKKQLSFDQLQWMSKFKDSAIIDNHILIVRGSYSVDYDILPTTSDKKIKTAFAELITDQIDEVWFGHYHYQIDREIDGVMYRCIRPVGHHRDKDTKASYSIYENGNITHKRVEYPLEQTVADFIKLNVLSDETKKQQFVELLENAYQEDLLAKDIKQMNS